MSMLIACPTEAPKPKDKGGGDDDTPIVYVEKISFPFISPHSIVADILLTDDIEGETTLVITNSETEPSIPNPVVITDGFIERKLVKNTSRQVYMAQLSNAFNPIDTGSDRVGTNNMINSLHAAFLKENKTYYLHLLYTKKDETTLTHKAFPFTTMAYSAMTTNGNVQPSVSFSATPNNSLNPIEWNYAKENFIMASAVNHNGTYAFQNEFGTYVASCDPAYPSISVPAECTDLTGMESIMFSNQSGGNIDIMLVAVLPSHTEFLKQTPDDTDTNVLNTFVVHEHNTRVLNIKKITE